MIRKKFNGPLFIVGMPRSGTKLLRSLLNRHSCIRLTMVETEFLPYWVKNWDRFGDLSDKKNFEKFYNFSIKLPYFRYMRDNGKLISCSDWYERCSIFSISDVFEALIKNDVGIKDKSQIWGDKSPSYIRHIRLIKEIFPYAKFIHIIRDVRDYCLSINYAWNKNMLRAAQRWTDNVMQCRIDATSFQDDYLEIRYEDLISDPESILIKICKFLGLNFEQNMLQLNKPTEEVGSAKGYIGIYSNNKNKYLTKMDKKIRNKIESIAADLLQDLGYEIAYDGKSIRLSSIKMRFYQILDGINTLKYFYRERGLLNGSTFWFRSFISSGNRFIK